MSMLLPTVQDVFCTPDERGTRSSVAPFNLPGLSTRLPQRPSVRGGESRAPAVRKQDIPHVVQKLVAMFASKENAAMDDLCSTLSSDPDNSAVVYDIDALRAAFASARDAYPSHWVHCMAIKCCPLAFVIQEILGAGFGIESSSFVELYMALAHGCPPGLTVFDSPAKTDKELEMALGSGVLINANSLDELERVSLILCRQDSATRLEGDPSPMTTARVGIRLNTLVGVGTISELSTSVPSSKFGVPVTPANLRAVVDAFRKWSWMVGLHTHVGSQGYSLEQLAKGVAIMCDVADIVDAELGSGRITVLDIGGGLPANYHSDDVTPTFREHVAVLKKVAPKLFENNGRQIITEFGRALVAKTAITVSTIEYVRYDPKIGDQPSSNLPSAMKYLEGKECLESNQRERHQPDDSALLPNHQTIVTHMGADVFLRSSYCPEKYPHRLSMYGKNGELMAGPTIRTDVAGPLCFEGDYVSKSSYLPRASTGDFVVAHDTGANTLSLFSRHCSRRAPAVYGYVKGEDDKLFLRILKKKESVRDVAHFWGASV